MLGVGEDECARRPRREHEGRWLRARGAPGVLLPWFSPRCARGGTRARSGIVVLAYRITPDSSYLVYRILDRRFTNARKGLLSAPLDGSRGTLPLHVPSALSDAFALSRDGLTALYASHAPESAVHSYSRVSVNGPREAALERFTLTGELTRLEDHGDALVVISGGDFCSC